MLTPLNRDANCDDVVVESSGLKLDDHVRAAARKVSTSIPPTINPYLNTSLSATPLHTTPYDGFTPAWDPGSQTPMPPPSPVREEVPPSRSQSHQRLIPQLVDVPLWVYATGDRYVDSDLSVSVQQTDAGLAFRHKVNRTLKTLDPTWVKPHPPNPARDNGLLVVVEGPHCGQFVHRVDHVEIDGCVKMILALVRRVPEQRDEIQAAAGLLHIEPRHLNASTSNNSNSPPSEHISFTPDVNTFLNNLNILNSPNHYTSTEADTFQQQFLDNDQLPQELDNARVIGIYKSDQVYTAGNMGDHFRRAALWEVGVYIVPPHHKSNIQAQCTTQRSLLQIIKDCETQKGAKEDKLLQNGGFPVGPVEDIFAAPDATVADPSTEHIIPASANAVAETLAKPTYTASHAPMVHGKITDKAYNSGA
ncbi:hypothetical protein CVT24_002557 [Panaeolus cyanescens]|uniref:Uncharacterized protein n=1 Tax=Panaeolus cyanescens TaxID=181874 RepID=A0A409YTY7_9AGAR|nr:hypothetical protein CVT24_002557 [Panaeolus cyanescens]